MILFMLKMFWIVRTYVDFFFCVWGALFFDSQDFFLLYSNVLNKCEQKKKKVVPYLSGLSN